MQKKPLFAPVLIQEIDTCKITHFRTPSVATSCWGSRACDSSISNSCVICKTALFKGEYLIHGPCGNCRSAGNCSCNRYHPCCSVSAFATEMDLLPIIICYVRSV